MTTQQPNGPLTYKHTWTFSRRSWIIRLYLWAWHTNVNEITFCKLFWAYVFMSLAILARPIWVLLWPVRWVCGKLAEMDTEAREKQEARKAQPPEPKEEIPGRIAESPSRCLPGGSALWSSRAGPRIAGTLTTA